MSDLERFNEIVDELWELVFGTVRRPEVKSNDFDGIIKEVMEKEHRRRTEDRRTVDRGTDDRRSKPKRARGKKGRYKGDDLTTKDFNEAWVGGKAPKKKKGKK